MVNPLLHGRSAFKAHRIFLPAMPAQVNDLQMVVLAGDMPLVTIEERQQIFRHLANFDAVAWPDINCV